MGKLVPESAGLMGAREELLIFPEVRSRLMAAIVVQALAEAPVTPPEKHKPGVLL